MLTEPIENLWHRFELTIKATNRRHFINYVVTNLVILFVFLIGYLLSHKTDWPYLRWLASTVIYFILPGYNISWLFFPRRLSELERLAISLFSSFILMTLAVYGASLITSRSITSIATASVMWAYAGTFLLGLVGSIYAAPQKNETSLWRDKIFWVILFAYLVVLIAIFYIYPFLPESDPYASLQTVDQTIHLAQSATSLTNRPLFTVLGVALAVFGKIPTYTVFKYFLPLAGIMMIPPIYAQAKRTLHQPILQLLVGLLPVSLPVVMLENVITRPDMIVMITLPAILYFLGRALSERWLVLAGYMVVLIAILTKFHELDLLLVGVALISFAICAWPVIRRQPVESVIIIILFIVAIWPDLRPGIAQIQGIWTILGSKLLPLHFRWWFLNNYTNIDGVQNGWPGWSWLEYYGYNFGLAVPILLILSLISIIRKRTHLTWTISELPALLTAAIFFTVAEILPRFNLAYLPDRAWPFLMLSVALLIPSFIAYQEDHLVTKISEAALALAFSLSVMAVLYVTYAKQGWVTANEYQASQFLANDTPTGSIVVTQGGNAQLVNYFGKRTFYPENVFLPNLSSQQLAASLSLLPNQSDTLDQLEQTKEQLISELSAISLPLDASNNQISAVNTEENTLTDSLMAVNSQLTTAGETNYPTHPNIYVLYSTDKFDYLYGQRSWWRSLNYANASFTALDNPRYFHVVYNKSGVTIWQLNY